MNDRNCGLVDVMNNRFAEEQLRRRGIKPHVTLSEADIQTIFDSDLCGPRTSVGFRILMQFAFGLCPRGRTAATWFSTIDQFKKQCVRGEIAWVYTGRLVGDQGATES